MIRIFFKRLAFIVLPFGLVLASVNYLVDPANIFSTGNYLSGIAGILSQGHNVENVSNYDERLLQEEMVKHLKQTPAVVILGSSRIMEVGSELFPGKKVLNCGVSHANVKDIIAITGLLDSMHRLPAEIFLNVDEGLISRHYTDEWKSIKSYYDYWLVHNTNHKKSNYQLAINEKLISIFSVPYFQASIQFMLKKKEKNYVDVGQNLPASEGRLSDGTIFYSYDYTHGNAIQIAQTAEESGKKNAVPLTDSDQEELLFFLLDFFGKKGISVRLCLMPYHPAYYSSVNKYQNNILVNYETYYRDLAQKYNLTVTGSFDPGAQHLRDTMFYDMYHCSRTAIKQIFLQAY